MILIALGANLPSPFGSPADTLEAAKKVMSERGIQIIKSARIWLTAPVPFEADQAWYHNSAVAVETDLSPRELLQTLLDIEAEFGRVRTVKNAPRLLDLDLIAYDETVMEDQAELVLPHPRMHERLFVLKPLGDIDKKWVHPKTKQTVPQMIASCSEDQQARPMNEDVCA